MNETRNAVLTQELSSVEDAVKALKQGGVIIVVDDEERENEGDFVAAAEKVTPEIIEFMITHGRGLLCMPIMPDIATRLQLKPMVEVNTDPTRCSYTVPVDHKSCRTGISAAERTRTVQGIIDRTSLPGDFVRPGHLFPLLAKEGGVLRRAGHTEATVDLARMAGLTPAGVICEITDGVDMARGERLQAVATKFGLPIVSIEALIKYRRQREKLVHRAAEADLPTRYGHGRIISYNVDYEPDFNPVVYVVGDLEAATAPLIRLHSSSFSCDLFESLRHDWNDQLHLALKIISQEGVGALVYLPQDGRGRSLGEKLKAFTQGVDSDSESNQSHVDPRDYGIGLQILQDLGLQQLRILTNNPKKIDDFVLHGHGLEIIDHMPITQV